MSEYMDWQPGLEVVTRMRLPEPYALSQLADADIELVVERLPRWYPEIQVGAECAHLTPAFYRERALLRGGREPRALLPLVIRHHHDGIVALITLQQDALARAITCRIGVLAPAHRTAALALLGPLLLEQVGTAIGAELAQYYATLWTRHQQVIAERRGFQLVGIVPGRDRSYNPDGRVTRSYEALYAKVLMPAALQAPPQASLTARTREVWSALFGPGLNTRSKPSS